MNREKSFVREERFANRVNMYFIACKAPGDGSGEGCGADAWPAGTRRRSEGPLTNLPGQNINQDKIYIRTDSMESFTYEICNCSTIP
jgi:hypothetical protein